MEKILFVASEGAPFVKTGGLADVVGALPQALREYENMDVRVILPLYDEMDEQWKNQMEYLASIDVELGWRHQDATIYTLHHNGVVHYFIANDYYFTRKGIYGYYDDGERFIFFAHAVMEFLRRFDFKPDILHGHDWQAGMAVALAKIMQPVPGMRTVFSIHNMKYQGVMPVTTFEDFFQLSREHIGGMEWNGMLNCLKSAIFHADTITTVSPTYANEIQNPFFGEGLESILNQRKEDLIGILNGIDTKEYNPLTDQYLPVNYRSSRVKKMDNKVILQDRANMPVDGDKPLYIMITRLVEQKGIHLVQHILDEFLKEDIQFMVLGTGDEEFEQFFREAEKRYPEKVKAFITFDEGLARLMYAAADFLVMPSQFEPCGLSQLISLQYKTIPIVRETGGLKDSVVPFNEKSGDGTGFSFTNYNAHDLLHVLRYSLKIHHDLEHWPQILKNINKCKVGWKQSAKEYANCYKELLPTPIYR